LILAYLAASIKRFSLIFACFSGIFNFFCCFHLFRSWTGARPSISQPADPSRRGPEARQSVDPISPQPGSPASLPIYLAAAPQPADLSHRSPEARQPTDPISPKLRHPPAANSAARQARQPPIPQLVKLKVSKSPVRPCPTG